MSDANKRQVGGDHYSKYGDLQPWDTWMPWNLNGFQCNVVKYVVRYRDKEGIRDLEKAKHYLDKLIELERERYGNETKTKARSVRPPLRK
ncbi:MAG TPA: DUF3310 domain-containing protein [Nitrospiraceae bacterium]